MPAARKTAPKAASNASSGCRRKVAVICSLPCSKERISCIVEVAETQSLLAQAESQNAVARVDVWRALLVQAVARGNVASFIEIERASGVQ